jgi:hypothetical protein
VDSFLVQPLLMPGVPPSARLAPLLAGHERRPCCNSDLLIGLRKESFGTFGPSYVSISPLGISDLRETFCETYSEFHPARGCTSGLYVCTTNGSPGAIGSTGNGRQWPAANIQRSFIARQAPSPASQPPSPASPALCEPALVDEIKKGEPHGSPFFGLMCRLRSAQKARMFRERLAPRERCVQLWFSSKPGGVMSPPELNELSSPVYSLFSSIASEEWVNTQIPQRALSSAAQGILFNEKSFPKLIPAYERLHRAESAEQVLDFAVLVHLLRRTQYRRRNNLQRV